MIGTVDYGKRNALRLALVSIDWEFTEWLMNWMK